MTNITSAYKIFDTCNFFIENLTFTIWLLFVRRDPWWDLCVLIPAPIHHCRFPTMQRVCSFCCQLLPLSMFLSANQGACARSGLFCSGDNTAEIVGACSYVWLISHCRLTTTPLPKNERFPLNCLEVGKGGFYLFIYLFATQPPVVTLCVWGLILLCWLFILADSWGLIMWRRLDEVKLALIATLACDAVLLSLQHRWKNMFIPKINSALVLTWV